MTNCKNIIFVLLLVCSLIGNTFAQPIPPWYKTNTDTSSSFIEADSTVAYNKLLAQTYAGSSDGVSVAGTLIGGGLTITGLICFVAVATADVHTDKSKSNTEQFGEAMAIGAGGAALILTGVLCTLIGLPILIYNISSSGSGQKKYANNRDDLQNELDYHKTKNSASQLMIAPTINLMNAGGGFNAILLF